MNYRRVTQFPATLSGIADAISVSTVGISDAISEALPANRSAVSQTPAGLFQKSSSFIWRAALRDQHRLLEIAAGALQRVAELFFAAAAKPPQYIFAAPNKLGIDCLDIDHETFVNPAKPYHTRCTLPAFIRVEPAIGSGPVSSQIGQSEIPHHLLPFFIGFSA